MTARGFVKGVELARDRLAVFSRSVGATSSKVARFGARLAVVGATKFAALSNAIKHGTTQLARFARGFIEFGKRLARVIVQLAKYSAVLVAAGVALAVVFVRRTMQTVDALAKISYRLGIAIGDLQALQYAAELSGLKVETLNMALQRMVRRISEAAVGTGEAQAAIKELGFSAVKLHEAGPYEALLQVADALYQLEDRGKAVRLAFKMFDSEGVAMLQMAQRGAAGLRELRDELVKSGAALTAIDASMIEAANNAIRRAKLLTQAFWQDLTVHLAPGIEAAANAMFELGTETISTGAILEGVFSHLGTVVGAFADWLKNSYVIMLKMKAWGMEFTERNVVPMGDMINGVWHPAQQPESPLEKLLAEIKKLEETPTGGKVQLWLESIVASARKAADALIKDAERIRKRGVDPVGAATDALRRRAEALVISLRSPWEVLQDSLADYRLMLQHHLIDFIDWARAAGRAWEVHDKAINKVKDSLRALADPARLRFAPATIAGTAEAVQTRWRATGGMIGAATVAVQQQQLKVQQGMGETLDEMNDILRRGLRLDDVAVLDVVT